MAIYENTLEEAKRTISENWANNRSKPNLFAHVQIRFGEKYMIDYTETYIRPGIEVLEDLMHKVDEICAGDEAETEDQSTVAIEENITLHQAILKKDLNKVRTLIARGDDIQAVDNDGATPLHYAAYLAHAQIAKLLLQNGAHVDAKNVKGETPLHEVAGHLHREGDEATIGILLDARASLGVQDNDGATPLHNAAVGGHYEAAKMLLDQGADIEARAQQLTPLHFSAYAGKREVTQLLIEHGADVFAEKDGKNPLYGAQQPSQSTQADKQAIILMLEQAMTAGIRTRPTTSTNPVNTPLEVRALVNNRQKLCIIAGAVLVVLMILFPPWLVTEHMGNGLFVGDYNIARTSSAGYRFILTPPSSESASEYLANLGHLKTSVSIAWLKLLIRLLAVVGAVTGLFFVFKSSALEK